MEAIRIENLTKTYKDVVAVDRLNLTVERGELFALLGVNGAGKTTTIKMLSCLTEPTSGDVLYFKGPKRTENVDAHKQKRDLESSTFSIWKNPTEIKQMIGVSPQETAVAPGLTVRENLELMCGVHGFTKAKREAKVAELMALLDLEGVSKRKAGKLSGGWQRRLSIAMALISEPEILFLDEPTLGLDVIARSELWDLIRGLKGRITIILTTHYMEEAEALSDRIAIMKDGRLLTCATAEEIKQSTGADKFEEAFIRIVRGGDAR